MWNFTRNIKHRIRQHYTPQEFIVIEHQRIIDSGTDDFALARKCFDLEKREVFIISPHHSDDVCEISTPEFLETIPL